MRDTSLLAYEDTKAIRERQTETVLRALGESERTALELVGLLESYLDVVQVRRRLSDLQKAGKVEDSGIRRLSHGRRTIVWRRSLPTSQGELF